MKFYPRVKKILTRKVILPAIFLPSIFFLAFTFFYLPEKKSEERLFLENVMIRCSGLYVLMGSKPMIDFPIDSGCPETEEECAQRYKEYLIGLEQTNENSQAMSYQDFTEDCMNSFHNHHRKLWAVWEKRMNDLLGPCYRFVAIKFGSRKTGLFINVPSTLLTLKNYFHEFSEVYGAPFDPNQVIDEISDENSIFWNRIFQSSYTGGLVLGYGKRNSFLFNLEQGNDKFFLYRFADLERKLTALSKTDIQVADLPLPGFCTFCLGDEFMENYKLQRSQIINEFRGKKFEEMVMQWLRMGKQPEHEFRPIQ